MSDLDTAIKFAVDAHEGQTDKAGQPYILHPLRVMLAQDNELARIVGVLHDIVEDSAVGHGDILAIFGEEVHAAVFAISRQGGEDYFDFVRRAISNPIARQVKIADLRDNMDVSRALPDDEKNRARLEKYRKAMAIIEEAGE